MVLTADTPEMRDIFNPNFLRTLACQSKRRLKAPLFFTRPPRVYKSRRGKGYTLREPEALLVLTTCQNCQSQKIRGVPIFGKPQPAMYDA